MSVIETRTAQVDDVSRIGLIMKAVWSYAEPNHVRIARVVQDASHVTLIAVVDGVIAGFVDGFATTMMDSILRWEVDLLAVHPDFQRQGLASRLVSASSEAGQKRGASYAQGLVAVDNVGSQKTFAHCGYETDGVIHELLVAERARNPSGFEGNDSEAYLLPVKTMNYMGLWIEGQRQKSGLQRAINKLIGTDLDRAGAVVSETDTDVIENAIALGFENVGRYQWWQRSLTSG